MVNTHNGLVHKVVAWPELTSDVLCAHVQLCFCGVCIPLEAIIPAFLAWLHYIGVDLLAFLPPAWKRKLQGQGQAHDSKCCEPTEPGAAAQDVEREPSGRPLAVESQSTQSAGQSVDASAAAPEPGEPSRATPLTATDARQRAGRSTAAGAHTGGP